MPIIHTETDLGALAEPVRKIKEARLGPTGLARSAATIARLWEQIRHRIDELGLPYDRVHLYQDGLPVCGREREIAAELAACGSLNHQLLLDLMARGAKLHGTEAPELLVQEYQLARRIIERAGQSPFGASAQERRASATLLARRDAHIGRRISETLGPGETGIVFLGMLHCLDGLLDPDIEVVQLQAFVPPRAGRKP